MLYSSSSMKVFCVVVGAADGLQMEWLIGGGGDPMQTMNRRDSPLQYVEIDNYNAQVDSCEQYDSAGWRPQHAPAQAQFQHLRGLEGNVSRDDAWKQEIREMGRDRANSASSAAFSVETAASGSTSSSAPSSRSSTPTDSVDDEAAPTDVPRVRFAEVVVTKDEVAERRDAELRQLQNEAAEQGEAANVIAAGWKSYAGRRSAMMKHPNSLSAVAPAVPEALRVPSAAAVAPAEPRDTVAPQPSSIIAREEDNAGVVAPAKRQSAYQKLKAFAGTFGHRANEWRREYTNLWFDMKAYKKKNPEVVDTNFNTIWKVLDPVMKSMGPWRKWGRTSFLNRKWQEALDANAGAQQKLTGNEHITPEMREAVRTLMAPVEESRDFHDDW